MSSMYGRMSEDLSLRKRNKQTIYHFRTDSNYQEGSGQTPDPKDLWTGFKGFTTIHGIPHIAKAKGAIKKIFWILCLLGCLTAFFYNLVYLIILYSKFYVTVRVQLLHNREMSFPAVTICNTNPVKSSAVYNSPRLVALLQSWGVQFSNATEESRKKRSYDAYPDLKETVRLDDQGPVLLKRPKHRTKRFSSDSSCSDIRYVTTQQKAISGHNDVTHENVPSGEDCYDFCSGNFMCKSADYDVRGVPGQTCNIAYADQYTADLTDTGTANWDYYEKCEGCATGHPEPTDTTRSCYSTFPDWYATYTCPEGKYWNSDGMKNKTIKCSCQTETWETISDTCEVKADCNLAAPDLSAYDIITINSPGQSHGEIAEYECIPGLQLVDGDSQAMCNDGTWEFIPTGVLGYCDYAPETTTTTTTEPPVTMAPPTTTSTSQPTTPESQTTEQPATTTRTNTPPAPTEPPATTKAANSRFAERNENPLREDFKKEEDLMKVLADLDEDTKKDLGYTFNDMIIDCQYEGTNCVEADFDWFFDAVHGNCYVFNSGWNWPEEREHFYSHRVGRRYGLKAVINIGQYEYLQGVGESAGAVVVVHPVDRMPFPEDEGVLAVPGSGTAIGVKKVEVIRKSSPYGDCIDTSQQNLTRNVFEEMYPTRYSSNACFKTCYQRHVIEQCGCADAQYPMTGEAFGNAQVEACDIRNIEQDDCKYEITQKYIKDELDCSCPNPCHDVAFLYSVSSNMWPAEIQEESVIDSLGSSADTLKAMNDSSIFRKNLLKIEVYFEEFNYEKIEEFPKYPLTKLFSDIGGIIGLWIGCSVISLAEFLELGLDFIVLAIYKVSKKKYWARSKHRHAPTPKSRTINTAASGNVLDNMNETNLTGNRSSNATNANTQLGVAPATYGGFMSRRNSLRNLSSRQSSARGKGSSHMVGSVNTGFQLPGIILEDLSEADVSNTASGKPPGSYTYYDDKKRKEKTHQSYLSRMTNLARKPLSSVSSKVKKKDKSPPPENVNRDTMPHVEGGLRLNLAAMYEDSEHNIARNSVRHRGQFSEENPPFKFI